MSDDGFPGTNSEIEDTLYEAHYGMSGKLSIGDHKVAKLVSGLPPNMIISVPQPKTEHALNIFVHVLPKALDLFVKKSDRYGEPEPDDLGVAGQFADMHRKWKVLRKVMWKGESLPDDSGEPIEEVLYDMIGHCLKTLEFLRNQKGDDK